MNFYRIKAVIMRHVLAMYKDMARIIDIVYWPLIDAIIWGFTSIWMQKDQAGSSNFALILLTSLAFWNVVFRSNIDISLSLLEELWYRNVVNLFSTPMLLSEWVAGMMCLGLVRSAFVFLYSAFIIWMIYGLNILTIGFSIIPFFLLLMISGWSIGFFISSFLIYWGQKVQTFVWAIGWLFALFSAVFYPLEVLPRWVQIIGKILPTSYIFEAVRLKVSTGIFSTYLVSVGLILNIFYLFLTILFFNFMFNKSKNVGLARLEAD